VVKPIDLTKEQIKEVSDTLIAWSLKKDSVHLASFTTSLTPPKTRTWLYGMAERHSEINEALEIARENLAQKYVGGSIDGSYSSFAEKYLPIYDKDYKALLKWKAELSKAQQDSGLSMQDLLKHMQAGTLIKAMSQPDIEKK